MKFLHTTLIILLILTLLWTAFCQILSAAALIKISETGTGYAAALLIGTIILIAGTSFCFTKLKRIGLTLTLAGALTIFITGFFIKANPNIGTRNVTFLKNQISLFVPVLSAAVIYTKKHLK